MQNISAEANKLQYTFREVLEEVLSRNEQIALAQQKDALSHNELALSVRSTLQSLLQDDMARLSQDVKAFDAFIVC
jgi:DNA repair ATPase RecN